MANISENMALALSLQNTHELLNAQKYYKAECWFLQQNLNGLASLMSEQRKGEIEHGQWLVDFITDREGKVTFTSIEEPVLNIDEILGNEEALIELFQFVLVTEIGTTEALTAIAQKALAESDFITFDFIVNQMLKEQREEESTANTWLQKAMLIGECKPMISQWDSSLID